jgi:hypothetical protein
MRIKTKSRVLFINEVSFNTTTYEKSQTYMHITLFKDSSMRLSLLLQMTEEIQSIKSHVALLLYLKIVVETELLRRLPLLLLFVPEVGQLTAYVLPRTGPPHSSPTSLLPLHLTSHSSVQIQKLSYCRGSINDDFRTHPCISKVCKVDYPTYQPRGVLRLCDQLLGINHYSCTHAFLLCGGQNIHPLNYSSFV